MATGFDLIGILLILVLAVSGLKKGLIDGVMKIVGVYAAIFASMNYNQYGTRLVEPLIAIPEAYKVVAGFIVTFLVVMYSISFIAFIMRKLVKTMHLGSLDRIGGITFGAMKAGLILSAVVWAFAMVPENMRGTWQKESKLYPAVEVFAGSMVKIFSLEDELVLLQSTVGSMMGKGQNNLLGGADASGGSGVEGLMKISGAGTPSGDDQSNQSNPGSLFGGGADLMQTEILKKAIESMEDPQRQMMEQALKAMQGGNANSLLEGAMNSKDASGNSLMEEALKYMDPIEQADMHDKIEQMEAEALSRQNKSQ